MSRRVVLLAAALLLVGAAGLQQLDRHPKTKKVIQQHQSAVDKILGRHEKASGVIKGDHHNATKKMEAAYAARMAKPCGAVADAIEASMANHDAAVKHTLKDCHNVKPTKKAEKKPKKKPAPAATGPAATGGATGATGPAATGSTGSTGATGATGPATASATGPVGGKGGKGSKGLKHPLKPIGNRALVRLCIQEQGITAPEAEKNADNMENAFNEIVSYAIPDPALEIEYEEVVPFDPTLDSIDDICVWNSPRARRRRLLLLGAAGEGKQGVNKVHSLIIRVNLLLAESPPSAEEAVQALVDTFGNVQKTTQILDKNGFHGARVGFAKKPDLKYAPAPPSPWLPKPAKPVEIVKAGD